MCGICGLFDADATLDESRRRVALEQMSARIARRGPDDEGTWLDPDGTAALGFRRLAILDLSPTGAQPMVGERSVLVFNGEIYNFQLLRRELESDGRTFRSTGDAEVLLACLETWGLDALDRLDGMFAFAWYETDRHRLTLARDHAGIKPLHWLRPANGQGLVFASQLDALLGLPLGDGWQAGDLRADVLALYLQLSHIPAPFGLYERVHQLEPGCWLRMDGDGRLEEGRWWNLPEAPRVELRGEDALSELARELEESVERQRVADVPLGVFLSGGVDSPLVTAVARRQTSSELSSFTLGNPGWWQDEAPQAARYAKALDVRFQLESLEEGVALGALGQVRASMHEPFADFSLLPTLLLSRFAREHVKVALSGDGGDELFFGYERPVSLLRDGRWFRHPRFVRRAAYYAGRLRLGPRRSDAIVHADPAAYYRSVNSRFPEAALARLAPELPDPVAFDAYSWDSPVDDLNLAHFARCAEIRGQLQRTLKKVDLASMHHGLEVRVPLLGRRLLDLSLRLDPLEQVAGGERKLYLRRLLERHVPAASIPRHKLGFSFPLGDLLRGPLREIAESTLLDGELFPQGLFRRQEVERFWRRHLRGEADLKWSIWALLALQWFAENAGLREARG